MNGTGLLWYDPALKLALGFKPIPCKVRPARGCISGVEGRLLVGFFPLACVAMRDPITIFYNPTENARTLRIGKKLPIMRQAV